MLSSRKIISFLFIMLCCISLIGCGGISQKEQNASWGILEKEGIIHEDWTLLEDGVDISAAIPTVSSYYLSLDSYGKSAVEKLIREESIRCREQRTSTDTSNISIQVLVDKNSAQV